MKETWRTIPGYEDLYKASNTGKILSQEQFIEDGRGQKRKKGRLLQGSPGPYGYLRVRLYNGDKAQSFTVHKLISMVWLGEMPSHKTQVDHIDGDPANNNVDNLRYVTNAENQIYANRRRVENGIVNPNLGRKRNRPVRISKGDVILEFKSTAEATKYIGCNDDGVSKAASGYNKSIYGWKCEYMECDE